MERVISDTLVQDPLGPDARPTYNLDHPSTYYYLDHYGLVQKSQTIGQDNQVSVPMRDIDGNWKLSWRNQPPLMKEQLENLLRMAAPNAPITIKKDAPLKEIFDLTNKVLNALIGTDGYAEEGINILLCSSKFKRENIEKLYDLGFDRHTVAVPHLFDKQLIALPSPEFLGALPLRTDPIDHYSKSFGAFVLPNNIINIELP